MSKYRIMVVDDDPDIRFVICGLLSLDFEMVQAESGLDALEKIERYEPDLIFVDVRMPIMDGFATCRAIRRHEEFNSLPVFFVTGAASDEARKSAEEAGSQGYVEKPFQTQELVDKVRGFFAEHRQPPRMKMFTMRELKKIDETPLRSSRPITVESGAMRELSESRVEHPVPAKPPVPEGERKPRRTFGAVPPPAASPAAPEYPETARFDMKKARQDFDARQEPPVPPLAPIKPPSAAPAAPPTPPVKVPVSAPPPKPPSAVPPAPPSKPPAPTVTRPAPPAAAPPLRPPAPPAAPPVKPSAPGVPFPPMPPTAPITEEEAETSSPIPTFARERQPAPPAPAAPRPFRPIPAEARKSAPSGGAAEKPRVLCMIDERAELTSYADALRGIGEFLPLEDPVEA
ncbi:response regulator, partial [Candidatus Poribacteria bacterium]|nr:response regulator [Candidatus Poribacteria bacterium]